MVPPAPDARASGAIAPSLWATAVSVAGKRDSKGQRQLAQNRLQAGKGLHGDRNADARARQSRAFWKSRGNLAVRKIVNLTNECSRPVAANRWRSVGWNARVCVK